MWRPTDASLEAEQPTPAATAALSDEELRQTNIAAGVSCAVSAR